MSDETWAAALWHELHCGAVALLRLDERLTDAARRFPFCRNHGFQISGTAVSKTPDCRFLEGGIFKMPEAIYDTASYFNNTYLDPWITEDFSKKMIKSVDRAVVLGPQAVESSALGVIPVTSLSGGTKTLLLIDHMPDKVFNASACGDNCAKWVLKIAERHSEDITINLHHLMDFDVGRRSKKPFDIRILNTGEVVHSMAELAMRGGLLLQEGDRI